MNSPDHNADPSESESGSTATGGTGQPVRKRRLLPRFGLKWLLLLMTVSAVAVLIFNAGMKTAYVKILSNSLATDDLGLVRGELTWKLSEAGASRSSYAYFICNFNRVDCPGLLELKPDQELRFRYRTASMGSLLEQDKYQSFLVGVLGIDPQDIRGYTLLEDRTIVMIQGHSEEPE